MAMYDYNRAMRMGRRQYQAALAKGEHPYLPVLDDILSYTEIVSEVNLGLVDVPLEKVVGTKTKGRTSAFANNFMPLLDEKTEFGAKWARLYDYQETEGIHDAVVAYEFMNKYYVMEGNKRVSVLKYVNAFSVAAMVTRLIPKRTDDLENKLYFEFLDFYQVSFNCDIWFSREGSYVRLLKDMGKQPEETWTEEERSYFKALYDRFTRVFTAKGGLALDMTCSDAFLVYIEIFGYDAIRERTEKGIQSDLVKIWEELVLWSKGGRVALVEQPKAKDLTIAPRNTSRGLMDFFLPSASEPEKLKIAFIYAKTPEESGWTYGHELGRLYLEETFPKEIATTAICHADSREETTNAIELAIASGYQVIFTTSPLMIRSSVKEAVLHPEIKICNCNVNTSFSSVRTYYGRMYEAKFLMGAIAAAVAETNCLGYVADYPIYGSMANINAFAAGARMINPRVKVHLKWKCVKGHDAYQELEQEGVSLISADDMITPQNETRKFGLLLKQENGTLQALATPIWHWGKFYEKIIGMILNGGWDQEEYRLNEAVNYWWGMSADVIDVICSQHMPRGTHRLITFLKKSIRAGTFHPFECDLYSQDGICRCGEEKNLSPKEIVTMDWLAENVIGSVPDYEELNQTAQTLFRLQRLGWDEEADREAGADENTGDR